MIARYAYCMILVVQRVTVRRQHSNSIGDSSRKRFLIKYTAASGVVSRRRLSFFSRLFLVMTVLDR